MLYLNTIWRCEQPQNFAFCLCLRPNQGRLFKACNARTFNLALVGHLWANQGSLCTVAREGPILTCSESDYQLETQMQKKTLERLLEPWQKNRRRSCRVVRAPSIFPVIWRSLEIHTTRRCALPQSGGQRTAHSWAHHSLLGPIRLCWAAFPTMPCDALNFKFWTLGTLFILPYLEKFPFQWGTWSEILPPLLWRGFICHNHSSRNST